MFNSPLYEVSNQFRLSTTSVLNMEDWPVKSNEYKLAAGNNLLDKATYHQYVLMGRELASNFSDNLSADFLFLTGEKNLRHGTGQHGLFLWVFLPSFIYGWYKLFPKYWKQGLVLLVWWISSLLPASVPESTPHALRSLNALVPLSMVIGWGTYKLMNDLNKVKFGKLINGLFIFASTFVVFSFTNYLFKVYPADSAADWHAGYKEVAQILVEEKEGKDTLWVEPFDGRFHLWVMGYGIPVSEFSEIEFEKYMPRKIDNIVFKGRFDWKNIETTEPKTIVAGKKEFIDHQLESSPVQPTWYKAVETVDGETPFVIVYFEK